MTEERGGAALLRVRREGAVERWTLDRPAARNAIDGALAEALLRAAAAVAADPACRVVLLDGAAPVFCAGSDLRELGTLQAAEIVEFERLYPRLRDALRTLPQAVVAVLAGGAYGGGLFLAAYADLRIAAADAIFAAPEVPLGWLPPGGMEELAEIVGVHRARELVLTGRRFDGAEARELGFADRVVAPAELEAAAQAWAAELALLPPAGVESVKRWARERAGATRDARDALQLAEFAGALGEPEAAASLARFARRAGARR